MTSLVHVHKPTRRDCIFQDQINPLDVKDDLGLFQHFRFPCHKLSGVTDEFNDLQHISLRKGKLPAPVSGQNCTCMCVFQSTL